MAYGFVYFLTNPSMPGLVKIGMTSNHPRVRMQQLTAATACPTPFELLAFFDFFNPQWAENEIHKALAKYRVNTGREFFNVPMAVLQDQMRQWGNPEDGCFVSSKLDYLARMEDQ